jgi:hypothetical protein
LIRRRDRHEPADLLPFSPFFGFALFYIRSVAPRNDCVDRIIGKTVKGMTTAQIYKGSVLFIAMQLIMTTTVIMFPNLVVGGLKKNTTTVNIESIKLEAERGNDEMGKSATLDAPSPGQTDEQAPAVEPESAGGQKEEEDSMATVLRSIEKDAKKKK